MDEMRERELEQQVRGLEDRLREVEEALADYCHRYGLTRRAARVMMAKPDSFYDRTEAALLRC